MEYQLILKRLLVVLSLAVFTFPSCKVERVGPVDTSIPASVGPITVAVTPGTATQAVLSTSGTGTDGIKTITFDFPADILSQSANLTVSAAPQSSLQQLPYACDIYYMSFNITADPASITSFDKPVKITAKMSSSVPIGTTLYLATLRNNAWVIVSTMVVGSRSTAVQNLATKSLPGVTAPGTYVLYQEPWDCGSPLKPVSNLGVALLCDDSSTLQVIHLYDSDGNVLATPTMAALGFSGAGDIDGTAITPDGSRGIIVDGSTNQARFFNGANIPGQNPIISNATFDLSISGTDGDAVAIMPSGDEAVGSGDGAALAFMTGLLSGTPTVGGTIPTPGARDGLVISNDGTVLLARGPGGLTVFTITPNPTTFTQAADFPALGPSSSGDGREGMALSPVIPCDRALIINSSTINLLTGLDTGAPTVSPSSLTVSNTLLAVTITPDGKYAVIGTDAGILMVSGVDTGSLALVTATPYAPSFAGSTGTVTLSDVVTLGITLDGLYAAVCDFTNQALLVIPIGTTGFSAPVGVLNGVTCPTNDQLVTH